MIKLIFRLPKLNIFVKVKLLLAFDDLLISKEGIIKRHYFLLSQSLNREIKISGFHYRAKHTNLFES
jgi:hypothetical protein